jgi:integrase
MTAEPRAATITGRYSALVVVAAGTGMRQGEAFGLTTESVHWLERTLTVDKSLSLVTGIGKGPTLGPTKTKASVRTIPLANHVLDALSIHAATYPPEEGYIFTNKVGGPIRRSSFNQTIWKPAVARAGLPGHTTFHDLRHTFASLVIKQGATPKEVQTWMGHATISETFDTYGHLFPSADDNGRRFIDDAFAEPEADFLLTSGNLEDAHES